jgi:hypothetical protein
MLAFKRMENFNIFLAIQFNSTQSFCIPHSEYPNRRNKPLLRREGDKIFKTGLEATQLLTAEAVRRDSVRGREKRKSNGGEKMCEGV